MSTKVKSARSRVFRLLKKAPMITGCVIFLSSVFFPYLRFIHYGSFFYGADSADIWSFKITFHDYRPGYSDFIMHDHSIPLPELPWINIMMLITQILVLATGIASLFINKKVLAFAPLAFCFTVIMLVLYVSIRIGRSFYNYSNSLQTGFYISLSSLPFYLIAFIVQLASSRRSKRIKDTSPAMTDTRNTPTRAVRLGTWRG